MWKGAADRWGMAAAFPPRPRRCVLRQGADHHNGHMGHLVPTSDTNCQYENVRASLTLGAPEARPILWRNPGATHRLKPPHTRRYSPAVPPSCTPSQRRRPTRQLRAALSPSNFLQSHLKFPSQLTQVPTAVIQPSNPCTSRRGGIQRQRRGDYQLRSKSCAQ